MIKLNKLIDLHIPSDFWMIYEWRVVKMYILAKHEMGKTWQKANFVSCHFFLTKIYFSSEVSYMFFEENYEEKKTDKIELLKPSSEFNGRISLP